MPMGFRWTWDAILLFMGGHECDIIVHGWALTILPTIDQSHSLTPSIFISTLTSILSAYGEKYQILHDNQEGYRAEKYTARQLQTIIVALEDARLTNQDIYILYIDFKNAFGSINHTRLLAIMKDLGYPQDAVALVGNIYPQSTTTFTGEHFGKTQPIPT